MTMACKSCGAQLNGTERFCGSCGTQTSLSPVAVDSTTRAMSPTEPSPTPPNPNRSSSVVPAASAERRPVQRNDPGTSESVQASPNVAPPSPVNVSQQTNIAFVQRNAGPNILVRAIWFVFIGWWLGGWAIFLAYILFLPIITIPLGIGIINRLPQIMTLRPRTTSYSATNTGDTMIIEESTLPQRPWWQRILYLLLIGWWFGAIWITAAWLVGILSVFTLGLTLPIAFWMFERAGAVTSLYRT